MVIAHLLFTVLGPGEILLLIFYSVAIANDRSISWTDLVNAQMDFYASNWICACAVNSLTAEQSKLPKNCLIKKAIRLLAAAQCSGHPTSFYYLNSDHTSRSFVTYNGVSDGPSD